MPVPLGWLVQYAETNGVLQVGSIRAICPHCGNASTFNVQYLYATWEADRRMIYMLIICNYAQCRKAVYVQTFLRRGSFNHQSNDDFYMYPSSAIDKPHPAIPSQIAEDWIEAQKAMQVSAPKAAAVMFRRVLYSVLINKGCKLHPLNEGLRQLIADERLPKIFDDWLPAIKDDGHDGAHPDRALQVSAENVSETFEYTAELLRFLYIEPYEFEQRKMRNAKPASTI